MFILLLLVATSLPLAVNFYLKLMNREPKLPYWVIILAAVLLFISPLSPSPLIHGENTNFGQHFVAGICAGLVGMYIVSAYSIKVIEKLFLGLAIAVLLGVAVEWAELIAVELGIINLSLTDTSWDLIADMSGAFVGAILSLLIKTKPHNKDINQ